MRRFTTAVAAALAAALIAAACGGGTGETAPATTTAPPPQTEAATTETAATDAVTTVDATTAAGTTEEPAENGSDDSGGGADVTAVVNVVGGEPDGGVAELDAKDGQRVRITVRSDAPHQVHLHGYDIEKPVGPGSPAVLAFTADIQGVFEVELEDTGTEIAKLSVSPS